MTVPSDFRLTLDRTRFPMLWSSAIDAYVGCVPVTKIQFEYFMCGIRHPRFSGEIYQEILERNPRIAPGRILKNNYHQAFITGVRPDEAEAFVEWASADGDDVYEIPTNDEWNQVHDEWNRIDAPSIAIYDDLDLSPRVTQLLKRLDDAARRMQEQPGSRKLAAAMLMHRGVLEWVHWEEGKWRWGGKGVPHPEFKAGIILPGNRIPSDPTDLDTRPKAYGFRIMKRAI